MDNRTYRRETWGCELVGRDGFYAAVAAQREAEIVRLRNEAERLIRVIRARYYGDYPDENA